MTKKIVDSKGVGMLAYTFETLKVAAG